MARTVSDVNAMQQYLQGVLDRADHHAPNVDGVALILAGAVIWRKDAVDVEVMEQAGEMKNVLWATINGTRYAFSYNHDNQAIDMRQGNTRGAPVRSFTNADLAADVKSFFAAL